MAPTIQPVYFRPPLYRALNALAASAFIGTLAADIAYVSTADFIWVDFSDWLVTTGVVVGFVAGIVGLAEIFAARRAARPPWLAILLSFVAWILAVADMLVHTRDGWTSVMPLGLILSALVVVVLAVSRWAPRAATATYPLPTNVESAT